MRKILYLYDIKKQLRAMENNKIYESTVSKKGKK
jgi:hypothetical protein